MPPKKKAGAKGGKPGKGSAKKKGKAKVVPEGPVEWKLSKERLAELQALPTPPLRDQVGA